MAKLGGIWCEFSLKGEEVIVCDICRKLVRGEEPDEFDRYDVKIYVQEDSKSMICRTCFDGKPPTKDIWDLM